MPWFACECHREQCCNVFLCPSTSSPLLIPHPPSPTSSPLCCNSGVRQPWPSPNGGVARSAWRCWRRQGRSEHGRDDGDGESYKQLSYTTASHNRIIHSHTTESHHSITRPNHTLSHNRVTPYTLTQQSYTIASHDRIIHSHDSNHPTPPD